ncbi:MAG: hypothetical protein IPG76_01775 [Acidobacteria bacterium]|nr:hypothetical protein [Acidobacteriota bacterium]
MSRIAIIGAGSWGTALALIAARAGNEVRLWARIIYLPGFPFPENIAPTSDLVRLWKTRKL